MSKSKLIQALQEHGIDKETIRELFLYYLTTEDRQIQMLEWIQENPSSCTKDSVLEQAQCILSGYLAKNPYSALAKDIPVPKWTPPPPVVQPEQPPSLPVTPPQPPQTSEDPFDKVLRALFQTFDPLD